MRKWVKLSVLLLAGAGCAGAEASAQRTGAVPGPERSTPRLDEALSAWLASFNNLELETFLGFFSPAATVFPPAPEPEPSGGRRIEPANVRAYWTETFRKLRERSERASAPFMNIAPRELRVEPLGADSAVVTFHLGEGPWVNRRTLVWRRGPEGWRIVHLHASRLTKAP